VADSPFDLNLSVEDLGLSVRVRNSLVREGIYTVGELTNLTSGALYDIRNFGEKSMDEVLAKLAEHGLKLAPQPRPAYLPPVNLHIVVQDLTKRVEKLERKLAKKEK
jgi:DNA-directed RNA polymerase alpha subunit